MCKVMHCSTHTYTLRKPRACGTAAALRYCKSHHPLCIVPCRCVPQGMDGRVMHPKTRKEMAYVVALGGEQPAITLH